MKVYEGQFPVIVIQWVDLAVDYLQLEAKQHTHVTRDEAVTMLLRAIAKGPEFSGHWVVLNSMTSLKPDALRTLSLALGTAYDEMPNLIRTRIGMQIKEHGHDAVHGQLCGD